MTPTAGSGNLPGIQTYEAREALLLAPYAQRSCDSNGRKHPEPLHPYRGPYQRDRDRILHSSAYRRLSGKMQVFTGDMGDYHRTRLTHTQEVASLARTIGRALRLNEDLIEALALFHDIGHPPFGHAGEDALHACLLHQSGFSHNRYALTIAEELERRYHSFPGLNLSHEVLTGQLTRAEKKASPEGTLLEVQVVDAADSMTYDAHDTDDAVKLGLVSLDELAELPLIRDAMRVVRRRYGLLDGFEQREAVVHELLDRQVTELLRVNGPALAAANFTSAKEARATFRIAFGSELAEQKGELERFLYQRVYRHPQLIAVRAEAQKRLKTMFETYVAQPHRLPERFRQRATLVGTPQAVGDYLAGMTDRYCDSQYEKIVQGE
jgi:dGTPase